MGKLTAQLNDYLFAFRKGGRFVSKFLLDLGTLLLQGLINIRLCSQFLFDCSQLFFGLGQFCLFLLELLFQVTDLTGRRCQQLVFLLSITKHGLGFEVRLFQAFPCQGQLGDGIC